jgi:hypothetical protein
MALCEILRLSMFLRNSKMFLLVIFAYVFICFSPPFVCDLGVLFSGGCPDLQYAVWEFFMASQLFCFQVAEVSLHHIL